MTFTLVFSTIAASYLLGSIPFGLLLTRLARLPDIRTVGSGNIGATNVMRTGYKGLGISTLLLDGAKGAAAVGFARMIYGGDFPIIAAFFAVIGHVFPVWLRFKGGKGVATALGVYFGLDWKLGLAVCAVWLVAFAFMRISSVSSLLAIVYSPIAAYCVENDTVLILCLALSGLIIYTHRSNIARLLSGTEYNFGRKKP